MSNSKLFKYQNKYDRITERNLLESPLLRLPGEVRNKIWRYTYGHATICVLGNSCYMPDFFWCEEYDLRPHKLKNKPLPALDDKNDEEQEPIRCEGVFSSAHTKFGLPMVCKQFWYETTGVFLSTYTLHFENRTVFHNWVHSNSSFVPHVQRLTFSVWSVAFLAHWCEADAFAEEQLGKLSSVDSLGLSIESDGDTFRHESLPECAEVPCGLRAWQGRGLVPEKSGVVIWPRWAWEAEETRLGYENIERWIWGHIFPGNFLGS